MARMKDITGQRFGSLIAIEHAGFSQGLAHVAIWKCRCDCGREQLAYVTKLRSGSTSSCKECGYKRISEARKAQGRPLHKPTYNSWKSMRARCTNPESPDYALYGGRGIKVCERWLDFEEFAHDMGTRPDGTSLDRVDTDGNYEPSNCRWSTPLEQANNKRTNVLVEWEGEKMTMAEFGRRIGMDRRLVRYYIMVRGMTPDHVITVTKKGGYGQVQDAH